MFTKKDYKQFTEKQIAIETVEKQLNNFKQGFPHLDIQQAATINNGIIRLTQEELDYFINKYNEALKSKKVLKFIPASGAASRMFKDMFSFMNYDGETIQNENAFKKNGFSSIHEYIKHLKKFPFYNDLKAVFEKNNDNIDKALAEKRFKDIVNALLCKEGLNYGNLPKGLLKFHQYDSYSRTPLEEHLVEGAMFCSDKNKIVRIHLTISPENKDAFTKHVDEVKSIYENKFEVKFDVTYSIQKTSTDVIAVDMNNEPFRNDDGSILFRPGGHGALIENLNDLDVDFVFIKNIDNLVPDRLREPTYIYKKAIGGILVHYQNKIFNYLQTLDNEETSDNLIEEINIFLEKKLNTIAPPNFIDFNKTDKKEYLKKKLNRPVRVCGQVVNEGEPGGGPFWTTDTDNSITIQIIEDAQINTKNEKYAAIVKAATHFNPTDLVCGIKDYKGNKFDLLKYIDPQAGFITTKSKDGKDLKAQELPGLWNGSMSYWNIILIEMPVITFNPVKIINDLLREQHQEN